MNEFLEIVDQYWQVIDTFLIFVIVNAIIAVLCYILYRFKRNKHKAITVSLFILFAPMIGILCIILAQLYNFIFYRKNAKDLSIDELSMSLDRVKEVVDIDIQKEADRIPLKEAMLVSDSKNRRKVLLEILKREKDPAVLSIIKEATKDEDTEVSHYAITFITDTLTSYRKKEEEALYFLEDHPSTVARIKYIDCLCEILQPGYFTDFEQEKYTISLDEQIEILRKEDKNAVDGKLIKNIVELWYQLDNMPKVDEYIALAKEISTKDLVAAKICLRYYYLNQNREEFTKLLLEIKVSTMEIDSEVLDWIRFFNII